MYTVLQGAFSAILALISVFTSIGGLFAAQPKLPEGAERIKYGSSAATCFDLYLPDEVDEEEDVLLIIHGGAWLLGDVTMFSKEAQAAADEGYVTACVGYDKLQNNVSAPQMVDEIFVAVAKVKETLLTKGITPDKMVVAGHSAGSQLAMMYSYTHFNDSPIEIAFVVGNSTPSNLLDDTGDGNTTIERFSFAIASFLSGKVITKRNAASMAAALKTINAYDNVTQGIPPTILVHGEKDSIVPVSNTKKLYTKIKNETDTEVELILYPDANHFLKENPEMDLVRAEAFKRFAEKYL